MWASSNGHSDIVIALIEAKADPTIKNNKGENPLIVASTDLIGNILGGFFWFFWFFWFFFDFLFFIFIFYFFYFLEYLVSLNKRDIIMGTKNDEDSPKINNQTSQVASSSHVKQLNSKKKNTKKLKINLQKKDK